MNQPDGLEYAVVDEVCIPTGRANLVAFLYFIPTAFVGLTLFTSLWGIQPLMDGISLLKSHTVRLIILLVIGVILHEGLHGSVWAIFAKNGLKSIRFGIKWAYLTPYSHCNEPLRRNRYIAGGIMPALITGIIPSVLAIIFSWGWLLWLGVFFTGAAGGDFMVLFRLLRFDKNLFIQDHPDEVGFIALKLKGKEA
ncbi:MAG: DUF3267 domain-containing protein [Bacteroidales bacterium]